MALESTARMTWRSWKLAFQVSKMSRKGCSRSIEITWPTILFTDSLVNWVNCPKWIAHVGFFGPPNFYQPFEAVTIDSFQAQQYWSWSSLEPFGVKVRPCSTTLCEPLPIGSMYGIYANIWGILMVNVAIYTIHGSYGLCQVSTWWPQLVQSQAPRRAKAQRLQGVTGSGGKWWL